MSKQVYLVCEKDVAGGINRQQFSQVLQEQEIEHEILPVSNRAVIDRPAISKELFSRIAWLCFSTPDAVKLFFAFFHDLHINEFSFKLAAKDLNTAAALLKQGLQTDYIPVMPLHLEQNSILNKQGELVVAVDGQEWAGLAASVNLIFTERKGLSFSIPEETKAIFLLNTEREAEYLFRAIQAEGIFVCKNPATAEICWQHGKTEVVLPADFTYEGMLEELKKQLIC